MTDYILKAVAEFEEMFIEVTRQKDKPKWNGYQYATHYNAFSDFLTQKLEHLARQKDEEFDKQWAHLLTHGQHTVWHENGQLKTTLGIHDVAELRNKLQGGKV